MPRRVLRVYAIVNGRGHFMEHDGNQVWCPVIASKTPSGIERTLKRVRQDDPEARVVTARVTIEDIHADE